MASAPRPVAERNGLGPPPHPAALAGPASDSRVTIGCCCFEIHLPASGSLKEKRKVVSSLRDRLRRRHNVSFAEVEHQDLWQRAGLAVVAVAAHRRQLEALFETIREEVARSIPGDLIGFEIEYL